MGREPLARKFVPSGFREAEGAGTLFEQRRLVDEWSRLEETWVIVRGSEARRFEFRVWLYSAAELRRMLTDVGFDQVQIFGHLDGRPYDSDASRLVAVARKPETPTRTDP
jgi:hypothetical protein